MSIPVVIDTHSGFCFGVKRAVETAEAHLAKSENLFSLGHIVHNGEEVSRLEDLGLVPVDHTTLDQATSRTVFFRAHGEPPASYQKAKAINATIVDATCPVVLKLQARVRKAWEEMRAVGGTVYIYGKTKHPEVIGLLGQTNNEAVVLESSSDMDKVDFNRPIELFCQTTQSIEGFAQLTADIRSRLSPDAYYIPHDTICRQVSDRAPRIRQFATEHDMIVFVGGTESSNAKVLFDQCRQANANSIFVHHINQITPEIFTSPPKSVGICGATSTPQWQLEQVANTINNILNSAK